MPIGIQTFEELRTEGYVYVDKTKYLVDLIDQLNICFLARPRRFGKSLTVTTFDALFSGNKELFKGLYAEEFLNRADFKPSPVIRLDMSQVTNNKGIEVFESDLKQLTIEIADRMGVEVPTHLPSGAVLRNLIVKTARKENKKVVILIDEYDKPYTDFVNDPIMANKVCDVLRDYYIQIKANDEYIRFTFITGISKFAKFGVFSTLNTPTDISLMPEYAKICGYTEDEIIRNFPDYLEETASRMKITTDELINSMRDYYNGFCFDREAKVRLYNPFSTLSFFAENEWFNYWIDTGRSKMIAEYLKNRHLTVEQFRMLPVSRDFAKNPGDMDSTPTYGFLYQSGYLTLRPGTTNQLSLDYPNKETIHSMSKLFTQNIVTGNAFDNFQNALLAALNEKNVEKLVLVFNRLLARIPYDDYTKAIQQNVLFDEFKFPAQEWLYRSSILSLLHGCGMEVNPEVHSNFGRADLVILYSGVAWVIEIKVAYRDRGDNPVKKAEAALRQIEDNNYAKPFSNAICIGLAIDDSERQITEWRKC